jgi:anaerobic selenocysteine-containing dehydrogenase
MQAREVVLTTCPRDCYDACGIAVVRRDGRVAQVRGDPAHHVSRGKLCGKCSTGYNRSWLDPGERLLQPLLRTGPKGSGLFEPASWENAIALVAERLTAIEAGPGSQTILNTHYTGTCSLLAGSFPQRFFNRLGATEIDPDSICNKAGHVALQYVYGTSEDGFDPRSARDAACILVWGANPSASAPHAHEHWLAEAPGTVVVVDPIRTETAAAADLHLQPFPGSDAALAFALLHAIDHEGLLDRDFLAEHAAGWEELEPLLAACTPAWAEEVTGVPAPLLEAAARTYARGPSLLWLGQGFQRQRYGGNATRACALLPAATGNLGRPGAGFLYLNGWDSRGIDGDYLTGAHLARSGRAPVSQMDLVAVLEDEARSRALLAWNINIAASSADQGRLRRALAREDLFTVVLDLFRTDTTDLADVILPAASFLEFDDLVASYFHLTISAQVKAMEPLGESLPNQEIFRRLARAMGFEEPELYEPDEEVLAALLAPSRLDFRALAAAGTLPIAAETVVQFADLSFPTPSGRIEIASERAEADGHPRTPFPHADPRPRDGRLRLLSPATPLLLNDSFANDPKLARRLGPAAVSLHPDDAAERGLAPGQQVLLENETGRLAVRLAVSDDVPRGVALSHKGRWPKREPARANVNVLNPGEKADMGESTAVHGVEVSISAPSA